MIHRRQSRKDFTQVDCRIDVEFAAGFDEAVDDCAGLAGVGAAEEEEVLFADGGGPDGILDEVVADFESAVFEVKIERVPALEGVVDRFAEVALRKLSESLGCEDGFYSFQDGC